MKLKTGNYLTETGVSDTIEHFQRIAHQILYGTYINKMYRQERNIIDYNKLVKEYGKQVEIHSCYDINFYRIVYTEATCIIQFLNSGLEIVCGVETQPEQDNF